jgi:hypothetical protein
MTADGMERETPPPKGDANIAEPPELNIGDKIRTVHHGGKDRTLTVTEVGHERRAKNLDLDCDSDKYVLEGYGTEYYLTTSKSPTGAWQRVDLVYDSRPCGDTVLDIEIIERAVEAETGHNGGDGR